MATAKRIVLNLDAVLAAALVQRRIETGTPTTEFIRRAIRLALFGDSQVARFEMRPFPAQEEQP